MTRTFTEKYLLPERRRWKIWLRIAMHAFLIASSCLAIGIHVYYPVPESELFISAGGVFIVAMLFLTPMLKDSETIPRYLGSALLVAHCAVVYIFLFSTIVIIGSTGAFKKTPDASLQSTFVYAYLPRTQ